MGFDSLRALEIELEEARRILDDARTKGLGCQLIKEQEEYVGQCAYAVQAWKMHEKIKDYSLSDEQEDTVIEYASEWSANVEDIAQSMIDGDLKKYDMNEYIEMYIKEDMERREYELFEKFQRWMTKNDFIEFVYDNYVEGSEYIVFNNDDDYVIVLDK